MSLIFLLAALLSACVALAVVAWRRRAMVVSVVFVMGYMLTTDAPLGIRLLWVGLLAAGLGAGYVLRLRRS